MHDLNFRILGLHHLLTGGPDRLTGPEYPPRYLWGDCGLPQARPRAPRRSWFSRLWWGRGL